MDQQQLLLQLVQQLIQSSQNPPTRALTPTPEVSPSEPPKSVKKPRAPYTVRDPDAHARKGALAKEGLVFKAQADRLKKAVAALETPAESMEEMKKKHPWIAGYYDEAVDNLKRVVKKHFLSDASSSSTSVLGNTSQSVAADQVHASDILPVGVADVVDMGPPSGATNQEGDASMATDTVVSDGQLSTDGQVAEHHDEPDSSTSRKRTVTDREDDIPEADPDGPKDHPHATLPDGLLGDTPVPAFGADIAKAPPVETANQPDAPRAKSASSLRRHWND